MEASKAALDIIKRNEGLRLAAYLDKLATRPVWTIGFGHTGPDVYEGLCITSQKAHALLQQRIAKEFAPAVLKAIGNSDVTQSQFDAMVSLAYNIGPEAFRKSTVARAHKAGNYEAAADAFLLWNKSGGIVRKGLIKRRQEERELYLSEI